jgi:drug/metabolite transporter (DMT)-like permease
MLNGAVPVVAAAIAAIMLRTLPGHRQLVGLALGFTGIVLIALPEVGEGSNRLLGVTMILVADLCYGLAVVIAAPLQQRYGPLPVMARMLALATLWTLPIGIAGLPGSASSSSAWDSTLVLGVLGTGIAFVLMGGLVGSVGSTRAAFSIYLIPVVATILGIAVRDETVAAVAVAGVALVIVGAILASRTEGPREVRRDRGKGPTGPGVGNVRRGVGAPRHRNT